MSGGARDESTPLAFFNALNRAFLRILSAGDAQQDLIAGLLGLAFGSFDGNVAIQAEGQPALDCRKGCAACCRLRVSATAPEVLLIARFVRATAEGLKARGIDFMQRIAEADAVTRGLNEIERIAHRKRCPFIARGVCTIYSVRTLACRGHASLDRRACAAAMVGSDLAVPVSEPHLLVRSMVQNAMQSALRDGNYAWGLYELNHALMIALGDENCETDWLAGKDVFAAAAIPEQNQEEMARSFDQLHRMTALS